MSCSAPSTGRTEIPTQIAKKSGVKGTRPKKKHSGKPISTANVPEKKRGWVVVGFDTSMSSIAGAAIAYDYTLDKMKGPVFVMRRWEKGDHYFTRLKDAVRSDKLVLELQAALGVSMATHEVWIAQEEPFPPHTNFTRKGQSGFLKQQAEISGAFLGGLLRYGYTQVYQLHNTSWRQQIAWEISAMTEEYVSIHHSKWRSGELATEYNCRPADSGKFRSKQWALDCWNKSQSIHKMDKVPDWPDIIESSKLGKIPRPEGSMAKALQPDDRYDALAIMWTLSHELRSELATHQR